MSTLSERLAVSPAGPPDVFTGAPAPGERLYGGLVVAQALHAAMRTALDAHLAHSVHAAFLSTGRAGRPVHYHVERTRDGSSYSTRRVVATQSERTLLVLHAGFQQPEDGEQYQPPAALDGLPHPDSLAPGRYDDDVFACRDIDPTGAAPHRRLMWGRLRAGAPLDERWAKLALAYHLDHGPTRAAREPHADHPGVEGRMSVSLDHSVWFLRHDPLDDWVLSTFTPISTGGGRGLVQGTVHNRAGLLLAAVAQEVVLRL
ncbi:MAG: acyl-CoA thioesterase [Vicinamibacterales bacterium]